MLILESVRTLENRHATLSAKIARAMSDLEREFGYLLPNGWDAIIEIEEPRPQNRPGLRTAFKLHLQSNEGSGAAAIAKLTTMKRNNCFYSGISSVEEVSDKAYDIATRSYSIAKDSIYVREISAIKQRYAKVTQIPPELLDWMRDELLFTPYLGAMSLIVSGQTFEKSGTTEEDEIVRVSFSGATQEQDVMFATYLLRTTLQGMAEIATHTLYTFDLEWLMKVPAIRFWLEQLDIKNAI